MEHLYFVRRNLLAIYIYSCQKDIIVYIYIYINRQDNTEQGQGRSKALVVIAIFIMYYWLKVPQLPLELLYIYNCVCAN